MGFTELKEEHKCSIAHEIIKSKQRDVFSSFAHQKLLKDPNNVVKFRKVKSIIFLMNHISDQYSGNALQSSNCFLKSCFFCHKPLSLHKEVYMYRGELGFCSVHCRNRQIYLDELKKIETYTKSMLASLVRQRRQAGRCRENTLPSDDYRPHAKPSYTNNQVTFIFS